MKLFLFLIPFCIQGTVFSQGYNDYSTMPRTININIVQPMKLVEPVDYNAISANLANNLNDISESRAAQKKAFEDMTAQAIRDVQNNKSLGYSSSLNDNMNAAQQKVIERIKAYYSVLTDGIIDPADYSNYLTTIVNDYISFAQSMSELNDQLKTAIDEMKSANNFGLIQMLSSIIDENSKNTIINYNNDHGDKNRRYKYLYNLGFTFSQKDIAITQIDYFRSYHSLLAKINTIELKTELDRIQNEINVDLALQNELIFQELKFNLPSTFKKKDNFSNTWNKTYSDGSKIELTLFYDNTSFKGVANSSNELLEKVRVIYDPSINSIPRIGIYNDKEFKISEIRIGSSSYNSDLKLGDKIISINNVNITVDSLIMKSKEGKNVGDTLIFVVERNSKLITIPIILKSEEMIVSAFDISVNGQNGYLFVEKKESMQYGEKTKMLLVQSHIPVKDKVYSAFFYIYPSKELSSKSNFEIFNTFKPLVKSINDGVIFK